MSISIDKIITVTGSVVNAGFNQAALIANALTENPLVPATDTARTLSFSSSTAVGAYFGTTSDEYMFATKYFAGYTNSRIKPRSILFSRFVQTPTAAYMFSSQLPLSAIAAIKALTAPALVCHINGATQTLTLAQADFSAATGFSDIATVIQTKLAAVLTGCTCTIVGTNQFQIKSPTTTPATTTIAYCTGNVADLLKLSAVYNPTLSQGTTGGDAAANMELIVNSNANWIALTYVTRLTEDTLLTGYPVTLALTAWITTQNNNYVGMWWEGGTAPLDTASVTNMRAILVDAGYGTTVAGVTKYNTAIQVGYNGTLAINSITTHEVGIYSAFEAGIGASIDYTAVNGKINFAGKRQDGLATNVNNDTNYQSLIDQGYNVYGNFATRASSYQFTETGVVGGTYLWIDNLYDAVWLTDQIQNALATLIAGVGRLPYNRDGQSSVAASLTSVAQLGLNNGVIEAGNVFDATQVQAIIELVGTDVSPQLTAAGYYIYFAPITAAARVQRAPFQVSFLYTNGGAVNRIAVGQVFIA